MLHSSLKAVLDRCTGQRKPHPGMNFFDRLRSRSSLIFDILRLVNDFGGKLQVTVKRQVTLHHIIGGDKHLRLPLPFCCCKIASRCVAVPVTRQTDSSGAKRSNSFFQL